MKLTAFTDYSLRVLIYLAADPNQRATIAEIAAAFGISENHLVKVVHFLGKHGWIETVRGKGGGIQLAMAAAAINVGRVVRDTKAPRFLRSASCPKAAAAPSRRCAGSRTCSPRRSRRSISCSTRTRWPTSRGIGRRLPRC